MSAATKIRVLTVDDHPLMRKGVSAVLSPTEDIELVAEAEDGLQALEQYCLHRPDVVLMDLRMPDMNGIDAIRSIRDSDPQAKVIVLTTYNGDFQALAALKAGAAGYLLKSMLMDDLVQAIRTVHSGRRFIPAEIAVGIAETGFGNELTARELSVLECIAMGASNKQVAADLKISEETVKGHVKNILDKLAAKDRTHALAIAIRRGLITL